MYAMYEYDRNTRGLSRVAGSYESAERFVLRRIHSGYFIAADVISAARTIHGTQKIWGKSSPEYICLKADILRSLFNDFPRYCVAGLLNQGDYELCTIEVPRISFRGESLSGLRKIRTILPASISEQLVTEVEARLAVVAGKDLSDVLYPLFCQLDKS